MQYAPAVSTRWLRGRVSDFQRGGQGFQPWHQRSRSSCSPSCQWVLGQPVALGTVEAIGRDLSRITPLLTETTETGVCSTTPSHICDARITGLSFHAPAVPTYKCFIKFINKNY